MPYFSLEWVLVIRGKTPTYYIVFQDSLHLTGYNVKCMKRRLEMLNK
jgi:hypothetical protein